MNLPSIRLVLKFGLASLFPGVTAPAALQTAPMGFYAIELKPGDQAVGISVVNPALLISTITATSGNRLATAAGSMDAGVLLDMEKRYYVELIAGPGGPADPKVGQRFEVDVAGSGAAATPNGEFLIDLTSQRSTSAALSGLAGYRLELREHLTLNQVFPLDRLFASTNFAEADQVQFFDGSGFEVCYIYGRNDGLAQWTGLHGFSALNQRVIAPGEGLIFRRSQKGPGPITLLMNGVARTTPFVQPLFPGYNFVAEGFPSPTSFAERNALPAGWQNGDRVKVYQSSGFVTYRLYSQGTALADNVWVTLGDRTFAPMTAASIFDHRSAAFVQLKTGDPAYRYFPPFTP